MKEKHLSRVKPVVQISVIGSTEKHGGLTRQRLRPTTIPHRSRQDRCFPDPDLRYYYYLRNLLLGDEQNTETGTAREVRHLLGRTRGGKQKLCHHLSLISEESGSSLQTPKHYHHKRAWRLPRLPFLCLTDDSGARRMILSVSLPDPHCSQSHCRSHCTKFIINRTHTPLAVSPARSNREPSKRSRLMSKVGELYDCGQHQAYNV